MKFFKALPIVALSIALAACSGGPSDSDVQAIADQAIGQMEQVMAATGVNLKEDFDVKVKIVNKTKQDDGRWLVQTQTSAVAKKDWQGGKKGDALPGSPTADQFYMQKGEKGWMASQ
jgi:hypothetical protein